jgi:hypothetical protein
MQDYIIHRSTRKCHRLNRPFEPSERYYSVVFQKGGELMRQDFAKDQWNEPPAGAIGWWTSQMPAKRSGKMVLAPVHVLLDALERLCESPDNTELAFCLALLLVRRRILTELDDEDMVDQRSTHTNQLEEEPSVLQLHQNNDPRAFIVPVCHPTPDRAEAIQQRLIELLYCES